MKDTGPPAVALYNAAAEPSELYEVPDASHVRLYDIAKDTYRAVDSMDAILL